MDMKLQNEKVKMKFRRQFLITILDLLWSIIFTIVAMILVLFIVIIATLEIIFVLWFEILISLIKDNNLLFSILNLTMYIILEYVIKMMDDINNYLVYKYGIKGMLK